jgi:YD repeat-containing protein
MKSFIPLKSCLALSLLLVFSCKKSNNSAQNNTSGSSLVRIQQGVDPNITNDSVYLIKYNTSKKIASITDSLNQDTLTAAYDAGTGKLSTVTETYGTNAAFTYDGNGLLTQINYQLAGSSEQYTFEYTNGVVSKKSYYSNLGSGGLSLQGYFTYTVANGNITSMTEYTKSGVLVVTTNFTYGTQANPFKDLSLFTYGNILGTSDVINAETYFNTNVLTGALWNGVSIAATYTFNANQLASKLVANNNYLNYVETWMFSYK